MKKLWGKIKLHYKVSKCLKTEEQREKRRFYLSLISLTISLISFILSIMLL
ncbi:MAG: hypothetical protein HFJ47_01630 [Clostridia bacterium]|nr:hypothetical protein [Clostridia bacterium]